MQKFKQVMITEKASQAKIIVELFKMKKSIVIDGRPTVYYDKEGGKAVVNQSGHIVELMPPHYYQSKIKGEKWKDIIDQLPVIPKPDEWKWQVKPNALCRRLLKGVKKAIVEIGCEEIIIASDNDKEGELLGWEVLFFYNQENHPNITRMLYAELTVKALKKAHDEKCDARQFLPRCYAGFARLFSDWLLGMNVTIALSGVNDAFIPPREPLNAGRVIFCMSYLIWLKEESIKNFVPQTYFTHSVVFSTGAKKKYKATVEMPERFLDKTSGRLINQEWAAKIVAHIKAKKIGEVVSFDKLKKQTPQPLGFDTTSLDKHLNKSYGLSLERITKATQALYEHKGLITYPRVEVKNVDLNEHANMPNYIAAMAQNLINAPQLSPERREWYKKVFNALNPEVKSKIWKKGIADEEAHHAIIPTSEKRSLTDLTEDEFLVYEEVCKRLIMQFFPPYEYSSTTVVTHIGGFNCKSNGTTPLRKGWKVLQSTSDKEDDADDEADDSIPILSVGEQVAVAKVDSDKKVTKIPLRYTIPSLLDDMENPNKYIKNRAVLKVIKKVQIGTGATRKPHLIELKSKGFYAFKKEGKGKKAKEYIHPTEKLTALVSIAPGYFLYPETSAFWEDGFAKIEKDMSHFEPFMKQQAALLKRFFGDLNAGQFRLDKPFSGKYQSCKSPCDGFVFFKKIPKKKYDLWTCGKCDSAYFDDKGSLGPKLGDYSSDNNKPRAKPTVFKDCPECKKDKVGLIEVPSKKYSFWQCQDGKCGAGFFDSKGELGNKMKPRK